MRTEEKIYRVLCDLCGARSEGYTQPSTWTNVGDVHACASCSDKPITMREVVRLTNRAVSGVEDDCG